MNDWGTYGWAEETPQKEEKGGPSWAWWLGLVAGLVVAVLLFLVGQGLFGLLALLLTFVLLLPLRVRRFKRFKRVYYFIAVPALIITLGMSVAIYWSLDNIPQLVALRSRPVLKILLDESYKRILWAFLVSAAVGRLLPISLFRLIFFVDAEWLTAFTGMDRESARSMLKNHFLDFHQPYVVIEKGETGRSRPKGVIERYGGPGIVVITPGNAVVFEQCGRITRIETARMVRDLQPLERIFKIIDLRPQANTHTVKNILTKDGIPLDIDLEIFYQIAPAPGKTDENPYPVSQGDLRLAAFGVGNWALATEFVALDHLRDVVIEYKLEDIFQYDPDKKQPVTRDVLRKAVKDKLSGLSMPVWGTKVTHIDIGSVRMPPEAEEQLLSKWLVERKRDVTLAKTRARMIEVKEQAESQARAFVTVRKPRIAVWSKMLEYVLDFIRRARTAEEGGLAARYIEALYYMECLGEMADEDKGRLRIFTTYDRLERPADEGPVAPTPPAPAAETHTGQR